MCSLQLKMSALEMELDKREAEVGAGVADAGNLTSAFGTTTVKPEPSYPSFALTPPSQPFSSGLSMMSAEVLTPTTGCDALLCQHCCSSLCFLNSQKCLYGAQCQGAIVRPQNQLRILPLLHPPSPPATSLGMNSFKTVFSGANAGKSGEEIIVRRRRRRRKRDDIIPATSG
jgi:hypothetical protein